MMEEIKKRDAYYCNLKILLLFGVVFGHWIEPYIHLSSWINAVYRIIYTVHMPLFIFLSGTFLSSCGQTKKQAFSSLFYYLIFQTIAIPVGKISGVSFYLYRPYWHLWYLLSLGSWSFFVWVLERWGHLSGRSMCFRAGVILAAVGIGCGAGCLPGIGRNMSLSRTIVFFPYLLAGQLFPKGFFRGKCIVGLVSLCVFAGLYLGVAPYIPTSFLYQADPYGTLGIIHGICLRLSCYLMSEG